MSTALLFVSLLLAAAADVPPSTPAIGTLGTWHDQVGGAVLLAPTATSTDVPTAIAESTATALPTATATARPTATSRPVVVPTATATATPTPPPSGPVINFTISPSSANYPPSANFSPCANNSAVQVPPVTLTLDNSKSTVAVGWRVSSVDPIASGAPWATIMPVTSGTVPAGRTQTITVNPASILCKYTPPAQSWQVHFATTNAGNYTFTYNVTA